MKNLRLFGIYFLLLYILMGAVPAFAVSDPCKLSETPIPQNINILPPELETYMTRLKAECQLKQYYGKVKTYLEKKYRLNLEQITEYQAMRFVRRVNFEDSKKKEIPIELTYQIKREHYKLPNSEKSSVIWDNWIKGIAQLPPMVERVKAGRDFTYEDLKQIHVGFFQLSNEAGDDAHIPDEGVIKAPNAYDNYWWAFETKAEADSARRIVTQINEHYRILNLLPRFADDRLNRVLDIRMAPKRKPGDCRNDLNDNEIQTYYQTRPECDPNKITYVDAIYSGNSRANLTHIQNILKFVKTIIDTGLQDRHLVWSNRLVTPLEAAFLAQKFYIGVHPFIEGNGRTGRFIQELILQIFEMPHGSSGDLMDSDVLSTFDDYYNQAITATSKLMASMGECLKVYKEISPEKNQSELSYGCRVLK